MSGVKGMGGVFLYAEDPLADRGTKGLFSEWGVAAQGAPPKRDKESDDGDSGTIDEELDAVSRRAPPLALRDGASRAPSGVCGLERRTTSPCGHILAGSRGWTRRGSHPL